MASNSMASNDIYLGRFTDPLKERAFLNANTRHYLKKTLWSAQFLTGLSLCLLILVTLTYLTSQALTQTAFLWAVLCHLLYLCVCGYLVSQTQRSPFPERRVFLSFWCFELFYGVMSGTHLLFTPSPEFSALFALHAVMALFAIYFYFPGPFLYRFSAAVVLSLSYWFSSLVAFSLSVGFLYHLFSLVLLVFANQVGAFAALRLASADRQAFALVQKQQTLNYELTNEVDEHVETRTKLEYLATVDSLTRAYNRRFFTQKLNESHYNAKRYQRGFALLALDLDYFKRVNDNYGHSVGDDVLKWFSEHIRSLLRESDIFARLGGEEFMLLLPETDTEGVITVAERLRKQMRDKPFLSDGENLNLTVSMGVTVYKHPLSPDQMMTLADDALYMSKEKGRDQVNSLQAKALKTPLNVGLQLPFGDMFST